MTDNCYYKIYKGPKLHFASLDGKDVTDLVNKIYGEECNWFTKLHMAGSIFGINDINKKLYMEWDNPNPKFPGFIDYTALIIDSLNTILNPPLAMPFSKNSDDDSCGCG